MKYYRKLQAFLKRIGSYRVPIYAANAAFCAHKAAPSSALFCGKTRRGSGAFPQDSAKEANGWEKRSCFCFLIHRAGGSTSTMIRVHFPAFTSKFSYSFLL